MRVYLSGSSKIKEDIRKCAIAMQSGGIFITHNWWESDASDIEEATVMDVDGVKSASLVVAVVSDHPSPGMMFEIGVAVGNGTPVLAVLKSPAALLEPHSFFFNHPKVTTAFAFEDTVFVDPETIQERLMGAVANIALSIKTLHHHDVDWVNWIR